MRSSVWLFSESPKDDCVVAGSRFEHRRPYNLPSEQLADHIPPSFPEVAWLWAPYNYAEGTTAMDHEYGDDGDKTPEMDEARMKAYTGEPYVDKMLDKFSAANKCGLMDV